MNFIDTVLVADVPNKNKHIYPKSLLVKIVSDFQDMIKTRSLFGQMDFPSDAKIYLENASHIVTKLTMKGDEMVAEIETISSPCGKVLKDLIENKAKITLRPYGVGGGKLDEDGNIVIDSSYKMISISVVDSEKAA